jgi:phosphatidylserine decarboxylase
MKSVDISLHHHFFPNINEDGWKFISILALLSLILVLIWFPLGCFSFFLTVWCFYSFRDPIRITPVVSDAVIAPVDGIIVSVTREKGPEVLGLGRKNFTRVGIFSSIFDTHISRMPIKCKINKTFYDAGKKFITSTDKNNIGNERMLIALKYNNSTDFVVQQTAVFCNKSIITKIKNSDEFLAGQKFGFTRFCAYTDIFLPEKTEPLVCVGQTMIAGETVMANINSDAPRIEGEVR